MKEFSQNLNFHLLLFIVVAFFFYLIAYDSTYIFSQQTVTPQSFVVQNFSNVIPSTSVAESEEKYESKPNDVVVFPNSSDSIQLTNEATFTETKANTIISEKVIYGKTADNASLPNITVAIPNQSLLNGTGL